MIRTRSIKWLIAAFAGCSMVFSCVPVKEYQKNRINDSEMTLANRKVEKNELNAQSYREGSSGANGGRPGEDAAATDPLPFIPY